MAESHTLFIVASNEFRAVYLKDQKGAAVALGHSTLVGIEEPTSKKPWSDAFQRSIVERIEQYMGHEGLHVRVAGHVGTCFGAVEEGARRDWLLPDKAEVLKGAVGGGLDIQVWGFHHEEEWSNIWKVLVTFKEAADAAATTEQKDEFEARLLKAFEQSGEEDTAAVQADNEWERHEHLSVIAHNIMGQLNPLQLKLDTAADSAAKAEQSSDPEYRARAKEKAARLLGEVSNLGSEKKAKALELLDHAARLAVGGENNECWKSAREMLAREWPTASNEAFRDWAGKVHDILKNLVR